jgi:hypothetical protein
MLVDGVVMLKHELTEAASTGVAAGFVVAVLASPPPPPQATNNIELHNETIKKSFFIMNLILEKIRLA